VRALLVAPDPQRRKSGAIGDRGGQQPFDLPDRAGDQCPGRDHAAGKPLDGVGRHGLEVGRERGQPSQVGSPLRGGLSRLLERHDTQQQPRPEAVADRHVPHRPQPVQVVGQAAQLTARQRHDSPGPAHHPPPRHMNNPTGTMARMALDGLDFHSAGAGARRASERDGTSPNRCSAKRRERVSDQH
jgi:hypothetical protein